jgi:hypothetical protein
MQLALCYWILAVNTKRECLFTTGSYLVYMTDYAARAASGTLERW